MTTDKEQASDKRVSRSIKLLREALISLIHEKNYDTITIQEIVERADVGRSTFYNHFYDKDSLLFSGFTEFVEAIHREQNPDPDNGSFPFYRIPSLFIFDHAGSNLALYRALLGSNGITVFIRKLEKLLSSIVARQMAEPNEYTDNPVLTKLLPYHVAKTFTAILSWWLDNNTPCPPAEINKIYESLLSSGIAGLPDVKR